MLTRTVALANVPSAMRAYACAFVMLPFVACFAAPPAPATQRAAKPPVAVELPRGEPLPASRYAFASSDRRAKLEKSFPMIDEALAKRAKEANAPGFSFALMIDGELAHVFSYGVADKATGAAVDAETRFRIGSITKTFTALALAKLRDEGKLASFEEPIEKVLPEMRVLRRAAADAGPIRFRDVTLHQSGLVRTGDYDESYARPIGRAAMMASLALPTLTTPYEGYSYSNYGYGLLGIAIEELSGASYGDYIERELAKPLGLSSAAWTSESVPTAHRARSYENKHGAIEPEWRLGDLDAAGGLFLSAKDVARWASFHAEAFPPRDTQDSGPVKRATIRELLSVGTSDPPNDWNHVISQSPLGWDSLEACGEHVFWKTGLVESFMSHVMFLPDHGIAFASLASTRMNLYPGQSDVLAALRATGGLERREKQVSPELERAMDWWLLDFNSYDEERVKSEYTREFWRNTDFQERAGWMRKQRARAGSCQRKAIDRVEHAGAGRFVLQCERASASISLALDSPLRQIAGVNGQWRYRATAEQREQASMLISLVAKKKPFWGRAATVEQKANEASLGAELRKLGTCAIGADLDTGSPDESLHWLRCNGDDVRVLRTVFAEGDPKKVLRAALEPPPRPPEPCKRW